MEIFTKLCYTVVTTTDDNGTYLREECFYNDQGNPVQDFFFDVGSNIFCWHENAYDSNRNVLTEYGYDGYDDSESRTEYTYITMEIPVKSN